MILINFGIQDGEREYTEWTCEVEYSKEDYEKGKVTDINLLNSMYGIEKDDVDEFDKDKYWANDMSRLFWVDGVEDITQDKLDIMNQYA